MNCEKSRFMKKVLTLDELQALADSISCDLGGSLEEEIYRSEGMITIDYTPTHPPKPYGILASLQERLHSDAEYRNLKHLI